MTAWDPPQQASAEGSDVATALTVDPFNSLAAHYGMLLGVSDFQVIGANPRGKMRLHQAWQHGKGVVWGFKVRVTADKRFLQVGPGMAIDALGREVAVGAEMCLDLHAWFQDRLKNGPPFKYRGGPTRYEFSAQLWLSHAACLARRVPSVSSSCGQGNDSVQYSRIHEFGHLDLRPYQQADDTCADETELPRDAGLDAAFAEVRDLIRDGTLPDLPRQPTDWLDAFRAVAAHAASEFAPPGYREGGEGTQLFPENAPGSILLADLPHVILEKDTDDAWRTTVDVVDLSVRRTHLPTVLIEELIAEALTGHIASTPESDAGGPRVRRMVISGNRILVDLTADILQGTLDRALQVRSIDRAATDPVWSGPIDVQLTYAPATTEAPPRVSIRLPDYVEGDIWYRVVLRGTGPTPLAGMSGLRIVPLAGRVGDPPGSIHDGHDAVAILRRDGAS